MSETRDDIRRDVRQPAQLLISIYGLRAARSADTRAKNLEGSSPAAALHWCAVAAEIRRLMPDPAETPAPAV